MEDVSNFEKNLGKIYRELLNESNAKNIILSNIEIIKQFLKIYSSSDLNNEFRTKWIELSKCLRKNSNLIEDYFILTRFKRVGIKIKSDVESINTYYKENKRLIKELKERKYQFDEYYRQLKNDFPQIDTSQIDKIYRFDDTDMSKLTNEEIKKINRILIQFCTKIPDIIRKETNMTPQDDQKEETNMTPQADQKEKNNMTPQVNQQGQSDLKQNENQNLPSTVPKKKKRIIAILKRNMEFHIQ